MHHVIAAEYLFVYHAKRSNAINQAVVSKFCGIPGARWISLVLLSLVSLPLEYKLFFLLPHFYKFPSNHWAIVWETMGPPHPYLYPAFHVCRRNPLAQNVVSSDCGHGNIYEEDTLCWAPRPLLGIHSRKQRYE